MLTVTIGAEITPGIYHAKGEVKIPTLNGEVDILLKKNEAGKLLPHLDSTIKVSKIAGREVTHYQLLPPAGVELKEGEPVLLTHFFYGLKK